MNTKKHHIKTKTDTLPFYFPLILTSIRNMPPCAEHSHDCCEIGMIVSGTTIHEFNGEQRMLTAGDVVVIQPGKIHSYVQTDSLDMYNVLFDAGELNIPQYDLVKMPGFYDIFADESTDEHCGCKFFRLPSSEFRHIKKILQLMHAEKQEIGRSGYRSAITGLFMNLLCHLLRSNIVDEDDSKIDYERNVGVAIKYLKTHYLEPFDLNYLLKISAMSRSNFIKYFHSATGVTPKQYVLRKRIAYAAKRIAETSLPLSEIAIECGFHDNSHFCKTFRKLTSETPNAYRIRVMQHTDRESRWSSSEVENPFFSEITE